MSRLRTFIGGWHPVTGAVIALAAALYPAVFARAADLERVTFPSADEARTPITAYYLKPPRPARAGAKSPAIVAMHGCGGLFARSRPDELSSRHGDWATRWGAKGYAVLMPDSFVSRGLEDVCSVADRGITPEGRALDAFGAAAWLASQPAVDAARIALVGWSNGGSTVLWASDARHRPAVDFRTVIAFYPGCRLIEQDRRWRPRVPVDILIGAADDWTPPEPCQSLADRFNLRVVQYPGAYHGFDAPNSKVRVRTGLAFTAKGDGKAHVGTNPAARAAAIDDVTRILAAAFK